MIVVGDRMTAPAETVPSDARAADIMKLLEGRRISAVPVVEGGRLVGIVSTTDLVRALATNADRNISAARVMTSPVVVASPDEPLDEAAWRLVAARVHRLIVAKDDRPVGVLSARDILAELVRRRPTAPIRAIMTSPVETVAVDDTIDEAIAKLASAGVHGLVVLDGAFPVGVFTHAEALAARNLPSKLRKGPVEGHMSYETICLDVATPIHRATAYSMAMNVRRILVVEQRHLVGILSAIDLVGVLARMPTDEPAAAAT